MLQKVVAEMYQSQVGPLSSFRGITTVGSSVMHRNATSAPMEQVEMVNVSVVMAGQKTPTAFIQKKM
tara:strand:- start:422 stop:622 length:201 start_codon:yes stop_codon:yes gene_type:complete